MRQPHRIVIVEGDIPRLEVVACTRNSLTRRMIAMQVRYTL